MENAYAFGSFLSGVCLLVVGFAHLFKHVLGQTWCHHEASTCIGPYLTWDKDDFFRDSNDKFRHTFSLMPKPLGENFGVLFLAFLTLRAHLSANGDLMTSFKQNASWLLIVALFGAFPFAGALGIVTGFICVAVAFIGFLCHFTNNQGSATLGLVIDTPRSLDHYGGSMRFPSWFFSAWNILLVSALSLTVINNFAHIFKNEFHEWCKDYGDHHSKHEACIGPWLIWPHDFAESINVDKFGSVFSLDINRALDLWTPMFLVVLFLALMNESWMLNAFMLVFLALFGAFGYSGNMGIITGFLLSFTALISFIVGAMGGREAHVGRTSYYVIRDTSTSLL